MDEWISIHPSIHLFISLNDKTDQTKSILNQYLLSMELSKFYTKQEQYSESTINTKRYSILSQ